MTRQVAFFRSPWDLVAWGIVALALAVAPLFAPVAAAEELRPPQGGIRPYGAEDFAPHRRSEKAYTENWAYRVQLKTGHLLVVNFAITNIGVTSGSSAIEVALLKDGTPIRTWNRGYGSERFSYDKAKSRIALADDIYVEGAAPGPQRMRVVISKNGGLDLDLMFSDPVAGVQDGDMSWRFGGAQGPEFGQSSVFTRAVVRGSMTIAGRKFAAEGIGSADHQLLTALPTKVAKDYLALRIHGPEYTVSLWRFESLPRYGSARGGLLVVSNAQRVLWAGREFSLNVEQTQTERGFELPRKLTLAAKGPKGESLAAAIAVKGRLQAFALTDELDPVVAGIAQVVVGNPLFVRDAARAAVKLVVDGKETRFEGEATQELNRMAP